MRVYVCTVNFLSVGKDRDRITVTHSCTPQSICQQPRPANTWQFLDSIHSHLHRSVHMYVHSSHTSTFTSYAQYKWVIVCRGRPACTMMCVVLPLKQLAIRPPYFLTRIWAWLYDKRKTDDSMKLHFIIICNLDSTNKCTVKPSLSGLLTLFLCTTFGHTKLISCSWSAGYRCVACAFSM